MLCSSKVICLPIVLKVPLNPNHSVIYLHCTEKLTPAYTVQTWIQTNESGHVRVNNCQKDSKVKGDLVKFEARPLNSYKSSVDTLTWRLCRVKPKRNARHLRKPPFKWRILWYTVLQSINDLLAWFSVQTDRITNYHSFYLKLTPDKKYITNR